MGTFSNERRRRRRNMMKYPLKDLVMLILVFLSCTEHQQVLAKLGQMTAKDSVSSVERKLQEDQPCEKANSCMTGYCVCGVCANSIGKLTFGKACSLGANCRSGYCEGSIISGCKGKCGV